jgi:hypothetical protein
MSDCDFLVGAGDGAGVATFTIFPWAVALAIGNIAPPVLQPAPSAASAKVSASISERDLIRPDSISVRSRPLKATNLEGLSVSIIPLKRHEG